ncbi:MAG TPA: alpha/beta hydrolase [Vicinamibacterales bacterium]|jgi:pimeloyl-ACP methyl ester carboxylesterase
MAIRCKHPRKALREHQLGRILPALVVAVVAVVSGQQPSQKAAIPTDRFVTVEGLRLHYVDWGNAGASPFIMVHGIDRIARTFDHVAPRFAARYHVIALDMRGHGDSGWDPAGRYTVEDHVGDLAGLVRELGLRNVTLWGNSTGGRVVQVFAGMHPELVSHVIAEDVGPERPRQIADNYSRRVAQEEAGWASEDELLAQLRKTNGGTSDAVLVPYVRYGTKRRDDGRIVWKRDPKLVQGFVATDLWRFVKEIKAPTLYVIGGRSTIVPQATQDELKKTLPRVTIVTMPGLGHYPSDEKPDEFVTIVDTFLGAS